jgi:hypothetical protein
MSLVGGCCDVRWIDGTWLSSLRDSLWLVDDAALVAF